MVTCNLGVLIMNPRWSTRTRQIYLIYHQINVWCFLGFHWPRKHICVHTFQQKRVKSINAFPCYSKIHVWCDRFSMKISGKMKLLFHDSMLNQFLLWGLDWSWFSEMWKRFQFSIVLHRHALKESVMVFVSYLYKIQCAGTTTSSEHVCSWVEGIARWVERPWMQRRLSPTREVFCQTMWFFYGNFTDTPVFFIITGNHQLFSILYK